MTFPLECLSTLGPKHLRLQNFEALTKSPAAGGQDGTDTSRSEPAAPKAKGPSAQSFSAQLNRVFGVDLTKIPWDSRRHGANAVW